MKNPSKDTVERRDYVTEDDIRQHLAQCPPACDCNCKLCRVDPGLEYPIHPEDIR
jgi:hypothetical protein